MKYFIIRPILVVCIYCCISLWLMQVVFAKDVIVTKQSWMDSMLVNMSAYACVPTGYFRSCYEITEDECFDKAIDVTQSCLNKLGPHIPMTLTQPRDGKYYGSMVGECFGTSFTSPYIKKKRYAPQPCNDPSNWK